MKSLITYIDEHKEDLINQVIMIMGTPGCGKTYWMQHSGVKFFAKQGLKINPKELDIDHTLKFFQIIDFPKFCNRVINYQGTSISDDNGNDIHNKNKAWEIFLENEKKRYTELNIVNKGLATNIPQVEKVKYEFVAPWLTRYENAKEEAKKKVFDEFVKAMYDEYFNSVFASDFSVRGEAKEQYKKDMIMKLSNSTDAFIAISGAKMKAIREIAQICKDKGMTCRIVYLNGSLEKAIGQDARRERSGGKNFVIDYALKIDNTWKELMNENSEDYWKNLGIYAVYELKDKMADDILSYPKWELETVYKLK